MKAVVADKEQAQGADKSPVLVHKVPAAVDTTRVEEEGVVVDREVSRNTRECLQMWFHL